MKRRTMKVYGEIFKTKKALRERIRGIRHKYADNERLNDADFGFMLDLLNNHEHRAEKIGRGVESMTVRTNPVYKINRGFWLTRTDGTSTDFSYEMCLRSTTKLQAFSAACRGVVADTVKTFKLDFFKRQREPTQCPITGELMTLRGNSHADHAPPMTFARIVNDFIISHGVDVNAPGLLMHRDGQTVDEFTDNDIAQRFLDYHNQIATLRVISKQANLSIARRDNSSKFPKVSKSFQT